MTNNSEEKFDIWKQNDYHKIKEHLEELDSYFNDIGQNIIKFLGAKSVRTKKTPSIAARKSSVKADKLIQEIRVKVAKQRQDFSADYS